jgi:hypothetical protein
MQQGSPILSRRMFVFAAQQSEALRGYVSSSTPRFVLNLTCVTYLPDFVHHLVAHNPAHEAGVDAIGMHDLSFVIELILAEQGIISSKEFVVVAVESVLAMQFLPTTTWTLTPRFHRPRTLPAPVFPRPTLS